jgi:hypothetical protein
MSALSGSAVLELWELGASLHPLDRSLLALGMAESSSGVDYADLPLGRRNLALLDLHSWWFGPQLHGWASCPDCNEKVEFDFDARELAATGRVSAVQERVQVGDHTFRLPTSRDLASVANAESADAAAIGLLERCRIAGPEDSVWTDEMLDIVDERLADEDPLAETRLALSCPSCGREWADTFDIGRFLWAEVEARARRILWEVHALARAYGWSEAQTLGLSPARRAMYLQMVHA